MIGFAGVNSPAPACCFRGVKRVQLGLQWSKACTTRVTPGWRSSSSRTKASPNSTSGLQARGEQKAEEWSRNPPGPLKFDSVQLHVLVGVGLLISEGSLLGLNSRTENGLELVTQLVDLRKLRRKPTTLTDQHIGHSQTG